MAIPPRPSVVFRDRSLRTGRFRGEPAAPPKAAHVAVQPDFGRRSTLLCKTARQFEAGAQGETKLPLLWHPVKGGMALGGPHPRVETGRRQQRNVRNGR